MGKATAAAVAAAAAAAAIEAAKVSRRVEPMMSHSIYNKTKKVEYLYGHCHRAEISVM